MIVVVINVCVEDKFFQNCYFVDMGCLYIKVCLYEKFLVNFLVLIWVCFVKCYEQNDKGQVEIIVDGCMECGMCCVLCEMMGEIEWEYLCGGFGVFFKFG